MLEDSLTQKFLEKNNNISKPEVDEFGKAKDVIQLFVKASSALKIYPLENPAVSNSIKLFTDKLLDFLSEYEELRIEINEFSLLFNGEVLHTEGEKKKSLPFLLYKDGMRELSFREGLDSDSINEFLEIIKQNGNLSEEESDIIYSLWEKDFEYIHYYALDEFLDKSIGESDSEIDFSSEKDKISSGRISLTQEDKEDISRKIANLSVDPGNDRVGSPSSNLSKERKVSEAAAVSKHDVPEIEKMVAEDRENSRIRELITLLFEVLFLEDRKAQFSETLDVLHSFLEETIEKTRFSQATLILNQIFDLREIVCGQDREKLFLLEEILKKIKNPAAIQKLKKLFFNRNIENFVPFLDYIYLLCPESLPFVVEIWEKTKDPRVRNSISSFLQKIAEDHTENLVRFAQDSRASIAKEVVSILGKIDERHSLPYLKKFQSHKEKSVRLETIQSLKNISGRGGDEVLLGMLDDKDEQIRIAALTSLKHIDESAVMRRIGEIIKRKDFDNKNRAEKRIFLNYCAHNVNEEIIFLLHSILRKKTFAFQKKAKVTQLLVVAALEAMASPEAVTILKEGVHWRNKRIKKACKFAIRKLATRHEQYREIKVM